MDFYFDKTYFGTPFHLWCKDDGTTEKLTGNPPENTLRIGSPDSVTLSELYGFGIPKFPPLKYRRFFSRKIELDKVPWNLVLPDHAYKNNVKGIVEAMREVFTGQTFPYYEKYFRPQNKIFSYLQPAKIDEDLFDDTRDDNQGHLKSFTPNRKGFAALPTYSRTGTITGRLKIEKGPMILNIKGEHRKVITSRFGSKGSVWQLDYASLEPRILLRVNDQTEVIPEDVYQAVIDDSNIEGVSRAAIKTAVLSRIFGAADNTIEKQLKDLVDYPSDVLSLVDEYFGIDELRQKLSSEFSINAGSHVDNFYGRRIVCKEAPLYVLLNYFIQSTGVDVCLLGFNQVVAKLEEAGILDKIVPLYILHDALFVDVHSDFDYLLPKICKVGSLDIPKFENTNFYLKAKKEV